MFVTQLQETCIAWTAIRKYAGNISDILQITQILTIVHSNVIIFAWIKWQHFSRSLTFISTFVQPLRRKLFHQVSRNKSRRKNILATVLMLIFDPIQCTLKITNINHTENLPGVYHMNIDLSFIRKRSASKIVVFQKIGVLLW